MAMIKNYLGEDRVYFAYTSESMFVTDRSQDRNSGSILEAVARYILLCICFLSQLSYIF